MGQKVTTIVCVLKTGGDYDTQYVKNLKCAVERNTTVQHEFVCLTDNPEVNFCRTMPLLHCWPGWWSKIELFRPDLPLDAAVYFDLDTVILGNIDALVGIASKVNFSPLRGFNQKYSPQRNKKMNFASGIMVGNFSAHCQVYHDFLADPLGHIAEKRENWMHGDQGFIASVIGLDVPRLQDFFYENYIVGKRITQAGQRIPLDARILAWSGEPRLHTMKNHPIMGLWGCNDR